MTLNKLPHHTKWVCFILGHQNQLSLSESALISGWMGLTSREVTTSNWAAPFLFLQQHPPSPSPSFPLCLPESRIKEMVSLYLGREFLYSFYKDNLLSKSNKPVSTLPMPPHPFLLSFLVLFSLFLSLWSLFVHLYSHTCHFNFCVEKTSHFFVLSLSLSFPPFLFFFFFLACNISLLIWWWLAASPRMLLLGSRGLELLQVAPATRLSFFSLWSFPLSLQRDGKRKPNQERQGTK